VRAAVVGDVGIVEIGHARRAATIGPEGWLPVSLFGVISEAFGVAQPLFDLVCEIAKRIVYATVGHKT
jgi:hypothetical protein